MDIEIIYDTDIKLDVDYEKIAGDIVGEAIAQYYGHDNVELTITFVDNERIKEINNEHRSIDSPTDVLSFPLAEYGTPGDFDTIIDVDDVVDPDTDNIMLGDIVISVEKVMSQAEEYGHGIDRELAFLIAHSMLHLMGYDHIDEDERIDMENRQELILTNMGYLRG